MSRTTSHRCRGDSSAPDHCAVRRAAHSHANRCCRNAPTAGHSATVIVATVTALVTEAARATVPEYRAGDVGLHEPPGLTVSRRHGEVRNVPIVQRFQTYGRTMQCRPPRSTSSGHHQPDRESGQRGTVPPPIRRRHRSLAVRELAASPSPGGISRLGMSPQTIPCRAGRSSDTIQFRETHRSRHEPL